MKFLAVLLLLISPAQAFTKADIQNQIRHTRYSVPNPTGLFWSFGLSTWFGIPLCIASAKFIAENVTEKRPLTHLELNDLVAGCVIPFVGPYIFRELVKITYCPPGGCPVVRRNPHS